MDRNSVTGLALIAVIMIVWLQFMSPQRKPAPAGEGSTDKKTELAALPREAPAQELAAPDTLGVFTDASRGEEKLTTIENDLMRLTISSKGATIKSVVLKHHLDGRMKPFDLIGKSRKGALSLLFLSSEGKRVDTRARVSLRRYVIPVRSVAPYPLCSSSFYRLCKFRIRYPVFRTFPFGKYLQRYPVSIRYVLYTRS